MHMHIDQQTNRQGNHLKYRKTLYYMDNILLQMHKLHRFFLLCEVFSCQVANVEFQRYQLIR